MILETDFADHWKTQRLVSICGAEAVLCLLRIWSYCQQRKRWQFDGAQASIIEWIGKWNGEKGLLLATLKEVGFIDEEEDGEFSMHDFENVNGKMVSNWANGTNSVKKTRSATKKDSVRSSKYADSCAKKSPALNEEPLTTATPRVGHEQANDTPRVGDEQANATPRIGHEQATATPRVGHGEANGTPRISQSEIEEKQEERKKERYKKDIYTPLLSPQWGKVQVEVFNAFCAAIDSDENIAEEDRLALASKFAEFVSYRRKIKPFKTANSGAHHARLACACMRDGLSAADIAALMQTAMDNEWQRWNIDSEIAKLKRGIREKSNTPPPQTNLDPSTYGVPQGALNY